MWLFSPQPSQKRVIKAYLECAEFLRFEVAGKPAPGSYPATAMSLLETYQGLAQTYQIIERGKSQRIAPNAADHIQAKMDMIKLMKPSRQSAYMTEIKDRKLYPMIWDGFEFNGSVDYKMLKKTPIDYYTAIKKDLQSLISVNAGEGHKVFSKERQMAVFEDQLLNMQRFEVRMLQRGLVI